MTKGEARDRRSASMDALAGALQAAIEFENRGYAFYLEAEGRARDPVVKSVLRSLAQDEQDHARVIGRYYQVVQSGRQRTNQPVPEVPASNLHTALEETVGRIVGDATFRSVYEIACALEVRSRDFYAAQESIASDTELARFFRFLAAVEQTHLEALELVLAAADRKV